MKDKARWKGIARGRERLVNRKEKNKSIKERKKKCFNMQIDRCCTYSNLSELHVKDSVQGKVT
jgi:hypothetical protein